MDQQPFPPFNASILIVEDDTVLANMLNSALLQNGATTIVASDGEAALKLLPASSDTSSPFDLILLDIDMPNLSGISVLQNMRARGLAIPVIMLTNLSSPEHIADAAELGVTEYLVKADWELDAIVQKVRNKLNKK